jgi:hypothetical protein
VGPEDRDPVAGVTVVHADVGVLHVGQQLAPGGEGPRLDPGHVHRLVGEVADADHPRPCPTLSDHHAHVGARSGLRGGDVRHRRDGVEITG